MARTSLYLLLVAILSPWLYDRYQALMTTLSNRPGKFNSIYNIKSHEIKFSDRIRNCEDLLLDEGKGLAILSCDPGRDRWNTVMGTFHPGKDLANGKLWLYDYSNPELPDDQALRPLVLKNFPNANDFHPLGIEWDSSTSTLYVINHAHERCVLEIFDVSLSSATATHQQTFKHPLLYSPNSIHSLGNGKLFITNDHYFLARNSKLLSKIETFTGAPLGQIVYIDTKNPDASKAVARLGFANGIAMINSTTLAVASTSRPAIYFYHVTENHDLVSKGSVRVSAGIDNLSVDKNGKLLMAGHPYVPTLMVVSKGRANCLMDGTDEEKRGCKCDAPSWFAEWTEEGGLRELYKGFDICSSCTAVRDPERGIGLLSALYDRGIMVFRE